MLPVECSHRLPFPAIDALMGLRRLASSHVPVYRLPQMRNRTSAMADANASRRRPLGATPDVDDSGREVRYVPRGGSALEKSFIANAVFCQLGRPQWCGLRATAFIIGPSMPNHNVHTTPSPEQHYCCTRFMFGDRWRYGIECEVQDGDVDPWGSREPFGSFWFWVGGRAIGNTAVAEQLIHGFGPLDPVRRST
jgi:hypothetical protein